MESAAPPASPQALSVITRASTHHVVEQLFTLYSAPIFNYVLRIVGDPDLAADVVQDTYVKAYTHFDTLHRLDAPRAWLYRIATNTAIDELRRRAIRAVSIGNSEILESRPHPSAGPEAETMARTLDQRIERALRMLRPAYRRCLLLSDVHDMSGKDMAKILGLSDGATRVMLYRARREMRSMLEREEFESQSVA